MILASFFDAMMEKYTLKNNKKRKYNHAATMSEAENIIL
jgi:hypothetical protein